MRCIFIRIIFSVVLAAGLNTEVRAQQMVKGPGGYGLMHNGKLLLETRNDSIVSLDAGLDERGNYWAVRESKAAGWKVFSAPSVSFAGSIPELSGIQLLSNDRGLWAMKLYSGVRPLYALYSARANYLITGFEYDSIYQPELPNCELCVAARNTESLWGMLTVKGGTEQVLPFQYKYMAPLWEDFLIAQSGRNISVLRNSAIRRGMQPDEALVISFHADSLYLAGNYNGRKMLAYVSGDSLYPVLLPAKANETAQTGPLIEWYNFIQMHPGSRGCDSSLLVYGRDTLVGYYNNETNEFTEPQYLRVAYSAGDIEQHGHAACSWGYNLPGRPIMLTTDSTAVFGESMEFWGRDASWTAIPWLRFVNREIPFLKENATLVFRSNMHNINPAHPSLLAHGAQQIASDALLIPGASSAAVAGRDFCAGPFVQRGRKSFVHVPNIGFLESGRVSKTAEGFHLSLDEGEHGDMMSGGSWFSPELDSVRFSGFDIYEANELLQPADTLGTTLYQLLSGGNVSSYNNLDAVQTAGGWIYTPTDGEGEMWIVKDSTLLSLRSNLNEEVYRRQNVYGRNGLPAETRIELQMPDGESEGGHHSEELRITYSWLNVFRNSWLLDTLTAKGYWLGLPVNEKWVIRYDPASGLPRSAACFKNGNKTAEWTVEAHAGAASYVTRISGSDTLKYAIPDPGYWLIIPPPPRRKDIPQKAATAWRYRLPLLRP